MAQALKKTIQDARGKYIHAYDDGVARFGADAKKALVLSGARAALLCGELKLSDKLPKGAAPLTIVDAPQEAIDRAAATGKPKPKAQDKTATA